MATRTLPATATEFRQATRLQESALATYEKRLLIWTAKHTPARINSDRLTALAFGAGFKRTWSHNFPPLLRVVISRHFRHVRLDVRTVVLEVRLGSNNGTVPLHCECLFDDDVCARAGSLGCFPAADSKLKAPSALI